MRTEKIETEQIDDDLFLILHRRNKNKEGSKDSNLSANSDNPENSNSSANSGDKTGWTPLHQAAYKGHFKKAKELIAGGADVNAKDGV